MSTRWACLLGLMLVAAPLGAQINMPDPKQISGVPLPAAELPAGTVSVRVIRGSFANNLSGVRVDFVVDGRARPVATDAEGRAQVVGLSAGARLKAVAVVNGERLESQEITIGQSGVRFVLAATDPDTTARLAEDQRLAAGPAVKGTVVIGPESRIVAEFAQDRLNIYYVFVVTNTARTPVDPGGPLIFDLPEGARGASILEESSKQATANGPRIIVTGPFAPGETRISAAFELPYRGATATVSQRWPATLQALQVFVLKIGDIDVHSSQIASKQTGLQQGQTVLSGIGPAIPQGESLVLELTGLPHHAAWPRYLALGLAGFVMSIGIWAAVVAVPRRAVGRV